MKRKLFFLAIMFVAIQTNAQFIRDKQGDVIPFSYTEKYKGVVRTDLIHSLVLPSYNNDSLFIKRSKGKTYKDVRNNFAIGFTADSLINFIDYAKKIEIDEGTLWIMTIESETAQSLGLSINKIDLPSGVYFSVYPGTIPGIMEIPAVGFSENIDEWTSEKGFDGRIIDKKIVVEFFVPTGLEYKPDIMINRVIYGFHGIGRPGNKINYEKMKKENDDGTSLPHESLRVVG